MYRLGRIITSHSSDIPYVLVVALAFASTVMVVFLAVRTAISSLPHGDMVLLTLALWSLLALATLQVM